MEWWETPGSEYDSYLSEGIIKKGVGAFAAYQVGKRALPWMAKKGIDMVHGAADTGSQLYQRAQDPQSHNRPDDYRYPAKKANPDDGKVTK
jgi:predicted Fe-Mo cluster-binding NifX family protein